MTQQETQQFNELKAQVAELLTWKKDREERQFKFPLDTQSVQALSQSLIPSLLNKISAEYGTFKQLSLGSGTTTPLTIASGVILVTESVHDVDTEGGAASDDLDTINSNNKEDGQILVLSPQNSSRTIVLKDGTGNLRLNGDFSMDSSRDRIVLIKKISTWYELCRSDNDT